MRPAFSNFNHASHCGLYFHNGASIDSNCSRVSHCVIYRGCNLNEKTRSKGRFRTTINNGSMRSKSASPTVPQTIRCGGLSLRPGTLYSDGSCLGRRNIDNSALVLNSDMLVFPNLCNGDHGSIGVGSGLLFSLPGVRNERCYIRRSLSGQGGYSARGWRWTP